MSTVFLDIDTQLDFVAPAGALYGRGGETVIPQVARLNRWAVEHGIALISTADEHAENDPEFALWPPHCVGGTLGQRKPSETLVGQTVLTKQSVDCFTIPDLPERLAELGAKRAVVYGVFTEICVKFALFGLLEHGLAVTLATDAARSLDNAAAKAVLEAFTARGGTLATLAEIAG